LDKKYGTLCQATINSANVDRDSRSLDVIIQAIVHFQQVHSLVGGLMLYLPWDFYPQSGNPLERNYESLE